MSDENDEALVVEVILASREEVAPDLDQELLKKCYSIQRRFQFSKTGEQASAAMERLIDEAVNALPSIEGGMS